MFEPVIRRSCVSASVMQTKRSVQTPVSLVRSLSGFALRLPVRPAQISRPSGPRLAAKTSGLRTKRTVLSDSVKRLVVLLQIQARVHARDLVGIAVEHQRLPAEELADPAL